MKIRENYNHTLCAAYIGYITQAIVNNFAPLLFLTFQRSFDISLENVALLISINFGVQLLVDLLSAKLADKIGYRTCMIAAHILSAAGLVGLTVLPGLIGNAYAGLIVSVVIYAIGGGLLEVLVSPVVEGCPTARKEAAMSLLHSFYCWGHVFVVLVSTLFFVTAGIEHWRWLAVGWALIPLLNAFYFSLVPINTLTEDGKGMGIKELFKNRVFIILLLLMICSGASEQSLCQWASVFAEAGLGVSKLVGDLAGPCSFAALMGVSRLLYSRISERISLDRFMYMSTALCIISYLLASLFSSPVIGLIGCGLTGFAVGILWPGTFSLAAKSLPAGGTAMFALLALGGDLGCSAGPGLVGLVSGVTGELRSGILAAIAFPALLLLLLFVNTLLKKKKTLPEIGR